MKMPRIELLGALETLRPAIPTKAILDELTHVWFDGESITAYNDSTLGIRVPFKGQFKGGLRGVLLLGMLSNSRAKEVELLTGEQEGELVMKAGGTRLRLVSLEMERIAWEFPEFDERKGFVADKAFLSALQNVLISVGQDTSVPDQLGVTFIDYGDDLYLYTTDSKTIASQVVKKPKGYKQKRIVVPTAFCEQIIKLGKQGLVVIVGDGGAIAKAKDGTCVFARLVEVPRPVDFDTVIARVEPKQGAKAAMEIPTRLPLAIERAVVMLETGDAGEPIEIILEDQNMRLFCETPHGILRDNIKVESNKDAVSCWADPRLLKRALSNCTKMYVHERAVIFYGADDFSYFVSSSSPRTKPEVVEKRGSRE